MIIKPLLYCSDTQRICFTQFLISLFVSRIIFPELFILYLSLFLTSTSLILKDISTILTFISLFSSHESIFFDGISATFFASFRITFSHLYKSKGVFGTIMPNTPIFSHTLFSNMPEYPKNMIVFFVSFTQ